MNPHEPDRIGAVLDDARAETLAQMAGGALGAPVSYAALSKLYEPMTMWGLRLTPDLSAGVGAGLAAWVLHFQSVTGFSGLVGLYAARFVLVFLPLYVAVLPPLLGWELTESLWRRLRGRYTTEDNDD